MSSKSAERGKHRCPFLVALQNKCRCGRGRSPTGGTVRRARSSSDGAYSRGINITRACAQKKGRSACTVDSLSAAYVASTLQFFYFCCWATSPNYYFPRLFEFREVLVKIVCKKNVLCPIFCIVTEYDV